MTLKPEELAILRRYLDEVEPVLGDTSGLFEALLGEHGPTILLAKFLKTMETLEGLHGHEEIWWRTFQYGFVTLLTEQVVKRGCELANPVLVEAVRKHAEQLRSGAEIRFSILDSKSCHEFRDIDIGGGHIVPEPVALLLLVFGAMQAPDEDQLPTINNVGPHIAGFLESWGGTDGSDS